MALFYIHSISMWGQNCLLLHSILSLSLNDVSVRQFGSSLHRGTPISCCWNTKDHRIYMNISFEDNRYLTATLMVFSFLPKNMHFI